MFEDLFWETSLPTYSYYDYLSLNKFFYSNTILSEKTKTLESFFSSAFLKKNNHLITYPLKNTFSPQDIVYSSPVNFDDSTTLLSQTNTSNFSQFSLISDLSENDDSYTHYKNFLFYNNSHLSILLGLESPIINPQSYLSVINNFRGDYEDLG